MQVDLLDKLEKLIPFEEAYNKEEVVEGYTPNQRQNICMKLIMEEVKKLNDC
jgi:hypothetical protein